MIRRAAIALLVLLFLFAAFALGTLVMAIQDSFRCQP